MSATISYIEGNFKQNIWNKKDETIQSRKTHSSKSRDPHVFVIDDSVLTSSRSGNWNFINFRFKIKEKKKHSNPSY